MERSVSIIYYILIIAITFLNTSTVMNIKPLCTSIALMDNCFRRISEVEVSEAWPHMNQTWTAIGNIDTYSLFRVGL